MKSFLRRPGLVALLVTWLALLSSPGAGAQAIDSGSAGSAEHETVGVVDGLPVFHRQMVARLDYPMSWTSGKFSDFGAWRRLARDKVQSCMLRSPPEASWDSIVIAEEDRGTYVARKIVFNLTGFSRVLAYVTVPKGSGPFPAVLLLHDHGAKFDIGKEKVLRPFGVAPEKLASADAWVARALGGRYLGDTLASRGYVCFATDILNWSDRGGGGQQGQQALASNLMHLGMSFAGLIAWEDMRAAEFLAQQPEVDNRRVAAMGLSVGGFRTWQIAALSEHISAGVSVCWITDIKSQMSPGINQTKGNSAYSMLHPGLFSDLDYPDVASIACPKPMLFYSGRRDGLFPQNGVERAYAKMRAVWHSQQASDRLETRMWEVGHAFTAEMQDTAFAWLDNVMAELKTKR